jgi:hypothetical protein
MSLLWDYCHQVQSIVTDWDVVTIAIAVILILVAGSAIQGFGALLNATLLALIGFAVALFIRGAIAGPGDPGQLAAKNWQDFIAMPMLELLAYALPFALLIAIIHTIRKLITGG